MTTDDATYITHRGVTNAVHAQALKDYVDLKHKRGVIQEEIGKLRDAAHLIVGAANLLRDNEILDVAEYRDIVRRIRIITKQTETVLLAELGGSILKEE